MGFIIFFIGSVIFISYILFYGFFEKQEKNKNKKIKDDDSIDYDGHGNWGRFPPKKYEKKKRKIKI